LLLPPIGCLLTGFLLVNRVPGNFHIEARSKYHNLNPALTNVSHIVHDLTFGPPMTKDYRLQLKVTHASIAPDVAWTSASHPINPAIPPL
jgi:hypothetical protein